jgi:hypothetical protein
MFGIRGNRFGGDRSRGLFVTSNSRPFAAIQQSTTHENPQLQGNGFPYFDDGDVVISLSPAASDTLILHSDKLSAFSETFRVGLSEPWSSNKIAGVRTVNGQDIIMKRYELDFAPNFEIDELDGKYPEIEDNLASLVDDMGRISLDKTDGDGKLEDTSGVEDLDSSEESHLPGVSMLVGKVHEEVE